MSSKTNISDMIIGHLRDRKILFVPQFAPYFIASFGAHIFNLVNKQKGIFFEHGRIPDMRMHTLFVAPPGFFKSMLMKNLVHQDYGCLYVPATSGNGSRVPMHFEGMVTEGAWTGSGYRDKKGTVIPIKGLAEEFSSGIVCFEEFSSLTSTMKQQHSLTLDSQILTTLDEGLVRKRTTTRTIDYETNMTCWAGTQQGRFDLSSGLGRRMYFMNWVPTPEESNALKKAYWDGLNIPPDKPALDKIRTEVSNLIDRVESIRKVDFDPAIPNLLGDVPHFEHRLHAHFAIGHQIMSGDFTDHLYVSMDETLRKLMVTAKSWREHLLSEAEGDQIIQILVQAGGKCTGIEICGRMLGFGSSVRQTRDILWRLANRARLIDWNEKEDSVTLKHPFKP